MSVFFTGCKILQIRHPHEQRLSMRVLRGSFYVELYGLMLKMVIFLSCPTLGKAKTMKPLVNQVYMEKILEQGRTC